MPRSRASSHPPPLAEAKLAAPRLRAELVQRARLVRSLDAGHGGSLTLVTAVAGYGKSTAVRAWCASRNVPFAWLTLDEGDNDPVRLWRYLATAVDRVREGLGRTALQRLAVSGGAVEVGIDELMNGIETYGRELVIVLDDLQVIHDERCLESLDYLLEHLVSNVRVVAITRGDPRLALPRLRARGALSELRAEELAFTTEEAIELLVVRGGVLLERPEIEALRGRTEGWPAALYLALLWLRDVDDPAAAIREFGARHRFVADFLANEVLGGLETDLRGFVSRVSVLGRVTPPLVDAVLERGDSAAMLAELERSNLLVRRLERGNWYSIHSLLAEYAALQLAAEDPGTIPDLHRRAVRWLREHDMPVEAIEHAAAAGEHAVVAELLVERHLSMLRNGNTATLLTWVQTLPNDCVAVHPELAAAGATAAAALGRRGLERRRLLHLADRARVEHPERWTPYAEAVTAMVRASMVDGDVEGAVSAGRRAVALSAAEDEVAVAALAGYAGALYLAGAIDEAWAAASQAIEHPGAEQRPGTTLARSTLALIAVDRGWLDTARGQVEAAKATAGRLGVARTWIGANVTVALGVLLTAEGKLGDAERELSGAEQFFRDDVASLHHAWLLVLLARVRCRRGRLDAAEDMLRAAIEEIGQLGDCGRIPSLISEVEREVDEAAARALEGVVLETPTGAELAVLRLLSSDLTTRQIGTALFLSPNTVRTHARALYRKLGVNSRSDAVARAEALGLLDGTQSPG